MHKCFYFCCVFLVQRCELVRIERCPPPYRLRCASFSLMRSTHIQRKASGTTASTRPDVPLKQEMCSRRLALTVLMVLMALMVLMVLTVLLHASRQTP